MAVSFEAPEYTANVDALGTLRILEAVRICGLTDKTRIYQASTSELYGLVKEIPQRESTPFHPRSPYGVAKLYAYWITVNYREAYGMYACNGLLFNHESPRRGETFVTRKITRGLARIDAGLRSAYSWATRCSARLGPCPRLCMQWRMLQRTARRFCDCNGPPGICSPRHRTLRKCSGMGELQWDGEGLEEGAPQRYRFNCGQIDHAISTCEVETLLVIPAEPERSWAGPQLQL